MDHPEMTTPNTAVEHGFNFDHSYATLPAPFFKHQLPTPVKQPSLALFNDALAESLGLKSPLLKAQAAQYLSGNQLFDGAKPIAQAYAGHQFGHLNMLGDGRAILLGEHITPQQQRVDIQLKGAGITPYSRRGDGRAGLGPMLREYIISEALHGLGIASTRSLAVVKSGEMVYRDEATSGAVLTRVAASHIRVGTFQFAAANQDTQLLQRLADYCIQRHFPALAQHAQPYLALLSRVIDMQARLMSQWMQVGFIHGVMNTDNMSISGESIDFGPCAFMNRYRPQTVFSAIDTKGRYAFDQQPKIAHWNLIRFAETLLPLVSDSEEEAIALVTPCLDAYPDQFFRYWLHGMRKKLGLFSTPTKEITLEENAAQKNKQDDNRIADTKLIEDLLMIMQKNQADYTNTFMHLGTDAMQSTALNADASFQAWHAQWQQRLAEQSQTWDESRTLMQANNPQVIPRNHLVEAALSAAVDHDNFSLVHALLAAMANPYQAAARPEQYYQAPDAMFDQHYQTFCGT